MVLAHKILLPSLQKHDPDFDRYVTVPDTWYLNSGVFSEFLDRNNLYLFHTFKYKDRETIEKEVELGKKKTVLKTDVVLPWDPVTGNIEIFSWSSDGSFRTGEATLWKGAYRFQDRTRDGKPPETRTIWRRPSPTTFEISLERSDGTRWYDVKVVTYERVKR
jgi:hypothetical protein